MDMWRCKEWKFADDNLGKGDVLAEEEAVGGGGAPEPDKAKEPEAPPEDLSFLEQPVEAEKPAEGEPSGYYTMLRGQRVALTQGQVDFLSEYWDRVEQEKQRAPAPTALPASPALLEDEPQGVPVDVRTNQPHWDGFRKVRTAAWLAKEMKTAGIESVSDLSAAERRSLEGLSELRAENDVRTAQAEYYDRTTRMAEAQNAASQAYTLPFSNFANQYKLGPEIRSMLWDKACGLYQQMASNGNRDPNLWTASLTQGLKEVVTWANRMADAVVARRKGGTAQMPGQTLPTVESELQPSGSVRASGLETPKPGIGSPEHERNLQKMLANLEMGQV